MFLNILLAFGLFIAGSVLVSLGIMQIIMVCRVSLPMINLLDGFDMINAKEAKKPCYGTIIIWGIITIVAIVLMILFANEYAWAGFGIGALLAFILGVGKTGPNETNKLEWLQANIRYITGGLEVAQEMVLLYKK